jgi:hypothetical protein
VYEDRPVPFVPWIVCHELVGEGATLGTAVDVGVSMAVDVDGGDVGALAPVIDGDGDGVGAGALAAPQLASITLVHARAAIRKLVIARSLR